MTSVESTNPVSETVTEAVEKYSHEFDRMCQDRHTLGEQKYGPGKFLSANTVEEAMFEVVDLANYARYTFIRLMLMNDFLAEKFGEDEIRELGPAGFKTVGSDWSGK
jgi:hypothetical protein